MDKEIKEIFDIIESESFITSASIAAKIGVSEKTVRNRIHRLDDEISKNGAYIHAIPGKGFNLEIIDKDKFDAWRSDCGHDNIPTTSMGRIMFILNYLLDSSSYIKLEKLCDMLYVSRNTITADMKQVEGILNMYKLNVVRRPNYGIKIDGNEINYRECIANVIYKNSMMNASAEVQKDNGSILAEMMKMIAKKYHMNMTEQAFESLIVLIIISNDRIQKGNNIVYTASVKEQIIKQVGNNAILAVEELVQLIKDEFNIVYTEDECLFLALHLCGKASIDNQGKYGNNLVISTYIDEIVLNMLDVVFESTGLDFRDNLELRMSLNQHMAQLDIRLRYNLSSKNHLLDQIKHEYAFAYNVALCASTVLRKKYMKDISEDEIGYLAVLFALVMNKKDKLVKKYNIVVVCASGRGTSQMFMLRYKQAFGKYINKIYESSLFELEELDFKAKKIDFVFTTVAINQVLPVPVFEVSLLLSDQEISNYQKVFENGDVSFLFEYFSEDLFVANLQADNKEEALQKLCAYTCEHRDLPSDFYDLVMKRESLGQTDFGNLVALPHPYHILGNGKFVSVGILDKPINWGHNDVQVIFLVSLLEDDESIEQFYHTVTNFFSDRKLVDRLIENPEYENLINMLKIACHR